MLLRMAVNVSATMLLVEVVKSVTVNVLKIVTVIVVGNAVLVGEIQFIEYQKTSIIGMRILLTVMLDLLWVDMITLQLCTKVAGCCLHMDHMEVILMKLCLRIMSTGVYGSMSWT